MRRTVSRIAFRQKQTIPNKETKLQKPRCTKSVRYHCVCVCVCVNSLKGNVVINRVKSLVNIFWQRDRQIRAQIAIVSMGHDNGCVRLFKSFYNILGQWIASTNFTENTPDKSENSSVQYLCMPVDSMQNCQWTLTVSTPYRFSHRKTISRKQINCLQF